MGYEIGYDDNWQRDIGYGVPAECDHPGCHAKIDRGLSYICGGDIGGGELGCGLFFCYDHLCFVTPSPEYAQSPPSHAEEIEWYETHDDVDVGADVCERCYNWHEANVHSDAPDLFEPTLDVEEWCYHKVTDSSWAEWRKEQGIPEMI